MQSAVLHNPDTRQRCERSEQVIISKNANTLYVENVIVYVWG